MLDHFDLVISSSNPFSAALVAYEWHRRTGKPWIADIGDPWSISLIGGRWVQAPDAKIEYEIFSAANHVVVTTAPQQDYFQRKLKLSSRRVSVVPAGFTAASEARRPKHFHWPLRVLHAGNVYGPRASVKPLCRAITAIRRENPKSIHLTWFGGIADPEDREMVYRAASEYHPSVPYGTVRQELDRADLQLVLGNFGGLQVPGKAWTSIGEPPLPVFVTAASEDPLWQLSSEFQRVQAVPNDENHIRELLARIGNGLVIDPGISDMHSSRNSWSARADQFDALIQGVLQEGSTGVTSQAPSLRNIVIRENLRLMGFRRWRMRRTS